jgi:hypothetical protein
MATKDAIEILDDVSGRCSRSQTPESPSIKPKPRHHHFAKRSSQRKVVLPHLVFHVNAENIEPAWLAASLQHLAT